MDVLKLGHGSGVPDLQIDKRALMRRWRYAVITFLRYALSRGVLYSSLGAPAMKKLPTGQYERWWSISLSRPMSKTHFLQHGGRYVRWPPIAQRRFVRIDDTGVHFWTDDHKRGMVMTRNTHEQFVHRIAAHVHHHYNHAIRHFGLLAPGGPGGRSRRLRPKYEDVSVMETYCGNALYETRKS